MNDPVVSESVVDTNSSEISRVFETIVVCAKWVDLRPDVDQVTGGVTHDPRRYGFSAADRAALELALQMAESDNTAEVSVAVLYAGPVEAEPALRELASAGVDSIVRVEVAADAGSAAVGASLANAISALAHVTAVICGDYSADRGSGSVPGLIAHGLGWPQALGLSDVEIPSDPASPLRVVRRLDGGRREILDVGGSVVISVEGSVAKLRRASIAQVRAARLLVALEVPGVAEGFAPVSEGPTMPIRPRAKALPAPMGVHALSRVVELTGALVERTPPRRVEAEPAAAAQEIVDQLRSWGYL